MHPTTLDALVNALVQRGKANGGSVSLDDVVDTIGDNALSYDEVERVFERVERHGVAVTSTRGARSEALLGRVLLAARELRGRHAGRVPSYAEIAEEAGMTVSDVQLAMAFARVVQR